MKHWIFTTSRETEKVTKVDFPYDRI